MPTSFENFVNTELPKRIATNESPTTPLAGDIPVFTGVGLLTESKTASEAGLATETFATDAANTAETNAKSYADDLITSIYKFQTTYNPQTTGQFPTAANTVGGVAIKKGFTWVVSGVTDQYTFRGVTVDNGDTLLALVDNASATSAADWHITEKNLGYTPENSSNKYSNDDLAGGVGTYPATPNVKAYVDTGLSGKQNTLADVITAGTYGSSTQYPVITFNAKGIATAVTLQTPTFTDANFSVQKNGSPSITASWSLTALTASHVHTYPDKAIDFGDLPSVATTNSNNLSGTRTRILAGRNNTIAGTDVVLLAASGVSTTNINWSPVVIESSDSSSTNTPTACLSTITCTKAINAYLANSGSVNLTTDDVVGTANTPRAWIAGSGFGATVASTSVHEIEFDLLHGIESFGFISYGAVFGVRKVAVYTDSAGASTVSSVQTVGTDIAVGTANGTLTMSVTIDTTNNRVVPTVTLSGATTAPIYLLAQAKIKSRYSRRA